MLLDQMEDATNARDKIDVHLLSEKAPRIQTLKRFPTHERSPRRQASLSASAQDFRALEEFEMDSILKALDTTPHSPRDVLEESLRFSDYSDTNSSSKESTSSSEGQCVNNNASLWRGFFKLWRNRSMKRLHSFPPSVSRISRWISIKDHHDMSLNVDDGNDFCLFKPSWKIFTSLELQNATNNFSHDNIIGSGGYAEVYEGKLENGKLVAIKKLIKGTVDEKTHLFLSELGILVHVNHEHIAKLVGVSVDGGFNFVFSLSPHGSLSTLLHGHGTLSSLLSGTYRGKLEWEIRYKIAIGTALGLEYLHDRCQRRIIHRDIKSANILITENFEPQICDFGLALWLPDQLTHHIVSTFEGTFGYLPPEYLTHGVVNEKTDIFAFGILLLELVSGRKAIDSSKRSLLMWARPLIEKNATEELVDPSMNHIYDSEQLKRVIEVASLCTQHSAVLRPRISEVLTLLRGEEAKSDDRAMHKKKAKRRTYSAELHDAEEYHVTDDRRIGDYEVLPSSPRRRVKQLISVPFQWEEKPGTPKREWAITKPTPWIIPPSPAKLIVSIPFLWEEKPWKPFSGLIMHGSSNLSDDCSNDHEDRYLRETGYMAMDLYCSKTPSMGSELLFPLAVPKSGF